MAYLHSRLPLTAAVQRILLCCLALLAVMTPAAGRQYGTPFFQNYAPNEYGASTQNWQAIQDSRGIMYFSNTNCVLEFDGEEWDQIYLPGQPIVRSLAQTRDGVIYVGAQGDIGYLEPTKSGHMRFVSIKASIPEDQRGFRDVWRVHAAEEGVYFLTDYKLFLLQKNGTIKVWLPRRSFFLSFYTDGVLYVHEIGVGLMRLQHQELQLVPGGERLADKSVQSMIPLGGNKLLIATGKDGLYLYDAMATGAQAMVPFDSPLNEELKANVAYSLAFANNTFVVGTLRNGVYLLDKGMELITVLNQEKGLQNNQVWSMQPDRQGGVWLCLNKGIARVELGTPITAWGIEEGAGKIFSVRRYQGRLLVASGQDVSEYDEKQERFVPASLSTQQSWTLHEFVPGNRLEKRILMAGTQAGVYVFEGGKEQRIEQTRGGFQLYTPTKFPNCVFYCHTGGVGVVRYDNGRWQFVGEIEGIRDEVRSVAEDESGNLWLGTKYRGVAKLSYEENGADPLAALLSFYDTANGIPAMRENYTFNVNNKVMLGALDGLYRYDEETDSFQPSLMFGGAYAGGRSGKLRVFHIDEKSYVWGTSDGQVVCVNPRRPENGNQAVELARLPQMEINAIWSEQDASVVWIGGSEGLYRYEPEAKHPHEQFTTLIRKVIVGGDSVLFYGNYRASAGEDEEQASKKPMGAKLQQDEQDLLEIPYADAEALSFHFSATYFDDAEANQFQYILEGNDRRRSAWTREAKKEYTNLSPGRYAFRVKARNIFGEEAEEAVYNFRITTPWYRTLLAYTTYLALAVALVWGLLRSRTDLLREDKRRLEDVIQSKDSQLSDKEREMAKYREDLAVQHAEIYQQQEELSTQRDYIEQQNKQLRDQNIRITESIRYAHTVQDGLLPFQDRLQRLLPDHFVLFKAKDIVSGDFYWFEQIGRRKMLAIADCTGHGVAGAFMTVVGITILNDILLKERAADPASALEEMHLLIRRILRQDQKRHLNDGIDIGLCIWEDSGESIALSFAGARIGLHYVRHDRLESLPAQPLSIGGDHPGPLGIANARLTLPKGTACYLYTDGVAEQTDQDQRKLGEQALQALLFEQTYQPMPEQKKFFEQLLRQRMRGHLFQKDDITMLGWKL